MLQVSQQEYPMPWSKRLKILKVKDSSNNLKIRYKWHKDMFRHAGLNITTKEGRKPKEEYEIEETRDLIPAEIK